MTKTTENEAPNSRADILKLKAKGKYQEFPYKVPGLKVSVSAKGLVGFVSRFRRPGGTQGILRLGPLDRTNRKPVETPVIGQSLTPEEAITLASVINTQRKNGVDVVAKRHVTKQFSGREKTFPTRFWTSPSMIGNTTGAGERPPPRSVTGFHGAETANRHLSRRVFATAGMIDPSPRSPTTTWPMWSSRRRTSGSRAGVSKARDLSPPVVVVSPPPSAHCISG